MIKKVLKILAYGNIWISLGAASLTLHSFFIFNWELDFLFLLMVFFATLASYNFQRVIRLPHISNERHAWVFGQKNVLWIVVVCSLIIASIIFLYLFSWFDLLYVSPLLLIGAFYALKFISKNGKGKALRDIPFIKIVLIGLSWGAVAVLLPAYLNEGLSVEVWQLFSITILYVFGITIPFDIRDLHYDEAEKKTIPQLVGVQNSKIIAMLLIIIAGLLYLFWFTETWYVLFVYMVSIVIIAFTNERRSELFFLLVVDGLLLLFPLLSCFNY